MIKYLIYFLFFIFLSQADAQISSKPLKKFPASYGIRRPNGAKICFGKIESSLSEALALNQRLKEKGLSCLVGDFDGNGLQDYAFLEKGWDQDASALEVTTVYVLMKKKNSRDEKIYKLPRPVSIFSFQLFKANDELKSEGIKQGSLGFIEDGEGSGSKVFFFKHDSFHQIFLLDGEDN